MTEWRGRKERNIDVGGVGRRCREIRVTEEEQTQTATKAKVDGNLGRKENERAGGGCVGLHGRACVLLLRIHCPVLSLRFVLALGRALLLPSTSV